MGVVSTACGPDSAVFAPSGPCFVSTYPNGARGVYFGPQDCQGVVQQDMVYGEKRRRGDHYSDNVYGHHQVFHDRSTGMSMDTGRDASVSVSHSDFIFPPSTMPAPMFHQSAVYVQPPTPTTMPPNLNLVQPNRNIVLPPNNLLKINSAAEPPSMPATMTTAHPAVVNTVKTVHTVHTASTSTLPPAVVATGHTVSTGTDTEADTDFNISHVITDYAQTSFFHANGPRSNSPSWPGATSPAMAPQTPSNLFQFSLLPPPPDVCDMATMTTLADLDVMSMVDPEVDGMAFPRGDIEDTMNGRWF